MRFATITPETTADIVQTAATGLSDTAIITIAVCVTVIVVTWILRVPAFKVRKCRDGITFKVGDIAQQNTEVFDTSKEEQTQNSRNGLA